MTGWHELDRLLDRAPGDYSVCVQLPGQDPLYTYAADAVRRSASLIKVPIAMAAVQSDLRRRAGGAGLDLDTIVRLREQDRVQGEGAWEGTLDVATAGTQRSYRQLIDHALRESDNTAANLLIAALGMDEINCFLRSEPLNLRATTLARRFIDFEAAAAGCENHTTAREMCHLLDVLVAASEAYGALLDALSCSRSDDALVAGLPPSTQIAHKRGTLPGVEHDAGLVCTGARPYIVTCLSEYVPDEPTGRATIAAASRLVYTYMQADDSAY